MASTEQTPAHVQDLANQRAKLPPVALLGIFGAATSPQALIRVRDGEIEAVTVGSQIAGGVVTAIADDKVILSRMGRAQTLRMPMGAGS